MLEIVGECLTHLLLNYMFNLLQRTNLFVMSPFMIYCKKYDLSYQFLKSYLSVFQIRLPSLNVVNL